MYSACRILHGGIMSEKKPRRCNGCTACCTTHEILELKKPAAIECVHSVGHFGCRLYPKHPSSCQEFKCEWLKGFGEDSHRPDLTGVVVDFIKLPNGVPGGIVQMFEAREGALESTYAKNIVALTISNGIFVSHIYLLGRKRAFAPSREVLDPRLIRAFKSGGFELSVVQVLD